MGITSYTEIYNEFDYMAADDRSGTLKKVIVDVLFDATYTASGEAVDFPANITALTTVHAVSCTSVSNATVSLGYLAAWDKTSGLLQLFESGADGFVFDDSTVTDHSATVVRCVVFGV